MTEDTTTQFRTEGQPAFPIENKENANSAASSAGEQTNVDQTQSQGGDQTQAQKKDGGVDDTNFADHPRWKEREDNWTKRFNDQEERHVGEITKLREEFEGKLTAITGPKGTATAAATPESIPAWFGGDESQWAQFLGWNQGLISKAKEEARADTLKEISSKTEAEQKAIDDATSYFNSEAAAIESDKALNPKGEKVDRNKLLKTAMDFDLVDSKGRWNYKAAWQFMRNQVTSPSSTQDRKNLASATTSENRAETKPSEFMTSADFQKPGNRPW